jgi:hypothetical protein
MDPIPSRSRKVAAGKAVNQLQDQTQNRRRTWRPIPTQKCSQSFNEEIQETRKRLNVTVDSVKFESNEATAFWKSRSIFCMKQAKSSQMFNPHNSKSSHCKASKKLRVRALGVVVLLLQFFGL